MTDKWWNNPETDDDQNYANELCPMDIVYRLCKYARENETDRWCPTEKDEADCMDAIYDLHAVCDNQYNRNCFRVFYKLLCKITHNLERDEWEHEREKFETVYEVDLRNRRTGDSVETIYSGADYDLAYKIAVQWNASHGFGMIDNDYESFDDLLASPVNPDQQLFADLMVAHNSWEVHGVGKY